MIIIYAILLASAGLSTLTEASAIKGHVQQATKPLLAEEGRSIKLAGVDKTAKSAPVPPVTPVLESSKKIYNDESIRRLGQPPVVVEQPAAAPVVPVVVAKQEQVAPVVVVAAASPSKAVPEPVVVHEPVVQQAPVVAEKQPEQSVVVKESPVVVAQVEAKSAPVAEQKPVVAEPKPAVVEPKSAPVEPKIVPAEPKIEAVDVPVAKPFDELPAQSERSAQSVVAAEKPAVELPIAVERAAVVPQPEKKVTKASSSDGLIVVSAPLGDTPSKLEYPSEVIQPHNLFEGKKDEQAPVAPVVPVPAKVEPLHIEVPAPDPGLVLSEPIDSTTKLLIDLDEHVQKFLPAEDQQQQPAQPAKDQVLVPGVDYSPAEQTSGKSAPLVPYSGLEEPIVPPLPSLDGVEKASAASGATSASATAAAAAAAAASSVSSPSATRQGNNSPQNQQQVITQLLDQLDSLQNRIQDTINQLVARRRYVMSALLRPMGTYVRRVRTNLERLQTRVNQLQAAAVSVGGGNGPSRPGGFVDAAAIETIRRRIDDISKRISDIVNRIRFSLTPTSAPMNSNGRK